MLSDDLQAVMVRELRALSREVARYPDDASLWRVLPGIANSGGTLALHLAGNLQHFVGHVLGGTAYVRDRDAEFGTRDRTRAEVVAEIERTITAVQGALTQVNDVQWNAEYPLEVGGRRVTNSRFAMHLAAHLAYHLGQVDYHRRIVAPASGTAATLALTEL